MTPYDLYKGIPAIVKHFSIFRSKCYIRVNYYNLEKNDSILDEGIFLGYATRIKVYKCYNIRLNKIIEIPYVRIDEEFKYRKTDNDDDHPMP